MENKNFPIVPVELLEALEKRFPERSPERGETVEELMWRGGSRFVIRFLRTLYENQNKNSLLKGSHHVQIG